MRVIFFEHSVDEFTAELRICFEQAGIIANFISVGGQSASKNQDANDKIHHRLGTDCRIDKPSVRKLRRLFQSFKPDIIYCSTLLGCFNSIVAQFPRKTCKVVCYRGALRSPNWLSPRDALVFKSGWVDKFHCACSAVATVLLASGIRRERVCVFPSVGYRISQFDHSNCPDNIPRRNARYRIGAVAHYRKVKGLEYLVDALELLTKRGVDAELLVIGKDQNGHLARYVRRSATAHRVVLAGPVVPPWGAMKTLDCLAVPSLSEGLCKVLIEALGCRVPIVATNVGGTPEIIEHGVNGLLVEPANSNQLAVAIEQILTDTRLANSLKERGKQVFLQQFEASVVASKYLQLLMATTSGSQNGR